MGFFNFSSGKKTDEMLQELEQVKEHTVATVINEVKAIRPDLNLNRFRDALRPVNDNLAIYPSWDIDQQTQRFLSTDDIYSIIRLLSTTAALIPLYGYLVKNDQKAFNDFQRELKTKSYNPLKLKKLETKALEDLPETDPVFDLMENPHETLSKFEFYEALYSMLFLYGECILLKVRPDLGPNAGKVKTLQFMHPQNVVIRISNTVPQRIVAYDYRVNGKVVQENISVEDIIHIKYFNPHAGINGSDLRGLSPLTVLRKRLTRMDSNMDVSVAQLQNGGVPGIVFDKSEGFDEKAIEIKDSRKDNFYRYLSNANSKGAPYFASGDMGYIQIGAMLADLNVAELAGIDFKKACNAWGVSDVLFNSSDTNSENNVKIQTARLYTNSVLPNVYRVRDALARGLLSEFQDGVLTTVVNQAGEMETQRIPGDNIKRHIEADISDISELQEDISGKVTALRDAYWLTPNEKREMMKYEGIEDELFNQPLIPTGLVTLQDLSIVDPIDPVTENGN